MTKVGGFTLPAPEAGVVANNELVIHGWDLARAIGADEQLDPELVDFACDFLGPQVDGWRSAGVFAAQVDVPAGASRQDQLLGLTGRQP